MTRTLVVTEADYANLSLLDSPKLQRRLASAKRVPSDEIPADVVTMNSLISYRDIATGERAQVQVVYPLDARARRRDRASVLSPTGLALLGAAKGEIVLVASGQRRLYIEEVLHQPESSLQKYLVQRERRAT